jgi:hypothetical protein
MFVQLISGDIYSLRITSTQTAFIDELVAHARAKIRGVWSQRGTDYSPTTTELGSTP